MRESTTCLEIESRSLHGLPIVSALYNGRDSTSPSSCDLFFLQFHFIFISRPRLSRFDP